MPGSSIVSIGVTALADAEGEEQDRELDRPEVEADEEDRLARDDRLGDHLGRVEREALAPRPRGSTAGLRATSR